MQLQLSRTAAVVALAAFSVPGHASASSYVVTFDDQGFTHGSVISLIDLGDLTIDVTANNFRARPNEINAAVAFDSTQERTRDRDLEDPFGSGNAPATGYGLMMILQEHDTGEISGGIATKPDDEGRRPAGEIAFDFSQPISRIGFDILDVDNAVAERTFVEFFDASGLIETVELLDFVSPGFVAADRSANTIQPYQANRPFDTVVFTLGGSMAIDNIELQSLPSPAAALVSLAMMGGLLCGRVRRH